MPEELSFNPIDHDYNLDESLVFARFGKLAKKKDILYSDFIEIDEPDEIGSTWVEFSSEVVDDLLNVVELTKSLFERLVDELRRSQDEPSSDELERIKGLTTFWLDISVIAYLYATIEKRGVLDQEGRNTYSMGYVNTKKSLDELTLLAFQAGQEFFTLESRITLGEALSLNMEKKRLDFIDNVGEGGELRNQILGEYDKNQALFLMTRVFSRLLDSSDTWWFLDAIALHSASEHTISHIESMKINWEKCASDFIEKAGRFHKNQYPIAALSSKVSLAQHYRRLAIAALQSRANNIASEYFGMAAELSSSVEIAEVKKVESFGIWDKSIPEQYLIYSQMSLLSTVSSKYQDMIDRLSKGKTDKIEKEIPELLETLSEILSQGDIAYVSSVALAYETVFAYIGEQLKKEDNDLESILSFVKNRMQTVGSRLQKASHQIVKNWTEVVKRDPTNIDVLQDLTMNIDYPLMAIFILPPNSEFVEEGSKELLIVQEATEALTIANKAEKEFGKNPVKEMLMRAKTFEITQSALKHLDKITDKETMNAVNSVLLPVSRNAFVRGLIAEIQLRTAVLQFHYINRIAPIIENSSLTLNEDQFTTKQDIDELEQFIKNVKELKLAASEVKRLESPVNIAGTPLNWKYISKLSAYCNGLVKILEAINSSISAIDSKNVEDAITYWDKAKTLTFEAADLVAESGQADGEALGQQVYTLAQIFYEFENKRRERQEINEVPVDGILELVSTLLMGL